MKSDELKARIIERLMTNPFEEMTDSRNIRIDGVDSTDVELATIELADLKHVLASNPKNNTGKLQNIKVRRETMAGREWLKEYRKGTLRKFWDQKWSTWPEMAWTAIVFVAGVIVTCIIGLLF